VDRQLGVEYRAHPVDSGFSAEFCKGYRHGWLASSDGPAWDSLGEAA
jgi:hypothetical protein